jgi:hypothetical protein
MTNDETQRITLFINPNIAKHARAQAIVEDLTLTSFVEKALIEYLPKETVIKKVEIRKDVKKNGGVSKRNSNNTE